MGSVRLTIDRKNAIHRKAQKAFELANREPTLPSEIIELIWQGAHNDPVQIATRNFISQHADDLKKHNIHISSTNHSDGEYELSYNGEKLSISFSFSTERISYGKDGYGWRHSFTSETLGGISAEQIQKIDEAAYVYLTAVDQRKERARNFARETRGLLEQCNTLKQLLESWPAAKEFVDATDIRQMHEKVTRKQAARRRIDTSGVDIDSLNQVVLTSKLVA